MPVLGVAAGCVVAVALFAAWFVLAERVVYSWDAARSWRATIDLAARLRHDPAGALGTVLRTLRRDGDDLSAVVALAPATIVLGPSRLGYVLALVVLYGLAAVGSVALFAERALLGPRGASRPAVVLAVVAMALVPAFWLPILLGLPDVVGCAIVPWIWWLARPPLVAVPGRRLALAGVLIALLVVLRRWYAVWAIAWLVALAVETAWRARRRGALVAEWSRLGAIVVAAAVTLLAATGTHGLAVPWAGQVSLRAAGMHLVHGIGAGWLACAAAGSVLALANRATRSFARLLLVQSSVILLLATHVRDLAAQHLYLLLPQLQVFAAVAVATAADVRGPVARRTVQAVVLLFVLVGLGHAFVPGMPRLLGPSSGLFAAATHPPRARGDLPELGRLVETLDALTRARHDRIYVLSSSPVLNDDVLRNAFLALPSLPDLGDRVIATAHVDRRGGLPWGLAQARFVVLTEPVGFHLEPREQQLVGLPAREILSGSTIGRSFARLAPTFALDGGVSASVYARTRELPRDEIGALMAALRAAAPDRSRPEELHGQR